MKRSEDYKKQLTSFGLVIIFLGILISVPFFFSYAQTAEELNNKINQKNNDIAKLEQEIKQFQSEIEALGKQKNSLSVSLKQLDLTKKKLTADISVTENKIEKTNLKIKELSLQINDKQSVIFNNINAISLNIREMSEFEQGNVLATILSGNNFTTVWNDIDNMVAISDAIREDTLRLKTIKGDLEDTRTETTDAKKELVTLKSKLADQKKIVDQNVVEKNKLLKQTKNSETSYQKLLKDQLAKKELFEKELREYESQLKFILDPSKLPAAGVLGWPLDEIFVTQQFGAKTGPHRTYASGHSGVDFRARTPLPVKAMASGVVKGTGDTDTACPGASFGRWVLIEYDNGLSSTYGHLSLIKVAEGQKVSRGEIVAYSGGTGRVTGPHLHVSLYVASAVKVSTLPSLVCPGKILKQPIAAINAYLDPMYYLPPLK
jgi:murein DD-endopeptidase MepM/ murein hydrolase activator NlpD